MTDWFTADQHFGHKNIIKYCDRPFSSIEEMDSEIISRWNSVVKPSDNVYVLGDFTLQTNALRYGELLIGNKFFIQGSHDYRWFGNVPHWNYLPPIHSLRYKRKGDHPLVIVLCHYSIRKWYKSHYGSYHLYGHSHCGINDPLPNSMDVGVDCHNFYPVSLEQVLEKLTERS